MSSHINCLTAFGVVSSFKCFVVYRKAFRSPSVSPFWSRRTFIHPFTSTLLPVNENRWCYSIFHTWNRGNFISWPNQERTMTFIPFANAPVGWIWSYKIIKATMTLMMNFSVSCCWIRPRSSGVSNIFWHTCIKSHLLIISLTPRPTSLIIYICISYMFLISLLPWPWLLKALLYC